MLVAKALDEFKTVSPRILVWCWRDAIAAACVPPLTKLVCYEISRHLSDAGKSWRIPMKWIITNTSLVLFQRGHRPIFFRRLAGVDTFAVSPSIGQPLGLLHQQWPRGLL
jgi:hypothetical protein